MSFWVAVAASALLGIFGYPPRAYQYWFSWNRSRTIGWSAFYLALAGIGGGGIGWLAARLTNASSVGNFWADGVLYAAVGTIAIRADLAPRPRNIKHDDLKAAASLLVGAINWISSFLDSSAETATTKWLRGLFDENLLEESQFVLSFMQRDPSVPKQTKDLQARMHEPVFKALDKGGLSEPMRKKYRANLISFCREYYGAQKTVKSTLGKRPASEDPPAVAPVIEPRPPRQAPAKPARKPQARRQSRKDEKSTPSGETPTV